MKWSRIARVMSIAVMASTVALNAGAQETPSSNPIEALQRANRLAMAGAWTRSVPHYEAAILKAGQNFPIAYFNFAEVLRAKKQCERAVLFYQAYLDRGDAQDVIEESRQAVQSCIDGGAELVYEGQEPEMAEGEPRWVEVTLVARDVPRGQIDIDGFPMFFSGEERKIWMRSGRYDVKAKLADHEPLHTEIVIGDAAEQRVELLAEPMLFTGSLKVMVDRPGARVRVEPRELDAPKRADVEAFEVVTPWEEARELPTGTYFVEVTLDDYHRWIRNVEIERDRPSEVNVRLRRMLPEAIRPQ
ncbi:hypothetical protein [Lujinxingia vulgaris]|uniref:hypothetical protein n=1 Tax=Lujinxingia vulgaris TaxID=2600176 RepID=UPI001E486B33|nr:hypothetical protein [Lujinxingia vulgaris]